MRRSSASVIMIALLGAIIVGCAFYVEYDTDYFKLKTADSLGSQSAGGVMFTAVMPKNESARLVGGEVCDFLEISNVSDAYVSLDGWTISRADKQFSLYSLGGTLAPGAVLTVPFGAGAPFKLSGSGMTLTLRDETGAAVDRLVTPELEVNQLWARAGDGWALDAASQGDIEDAGVKITEIMPRGEEFDYIELYNASGADISLSGWYLSDSGDAPFRWRLPDIALGAGEYLVIYATGLSKTDGQGRVHANFRLAKEGERVVLTAPTGVCADAVEYPALEKEQAYSLVNGAWTADMPRTPGRSNDETGARQADADFLAMYGNGVYIVEINAAATDDMPDFVKIYNSTDADFDLSGCGLSDEAGTPRKFMFPEGDIIYANTTKTVFMSGYPDASGLETHASFKLSALGGYCVTLSTPDGALFDRLYVPPQVEGTTYKRE